GALQALRQRRRVAVRRGTALGAGARTGRHHDDAHPNHHDDDDAAGRVDDHDDRDRALMRIRRVAILLVIALLLQVTIFPHIRLSGRVPDLGLVLAVAIAFDYGPEAGAIVGFLA